MRSSKAAVVCAAWVPAAATLALAGCGASIRHDVHVTASRRGLALGTPVRFRNIPRLRPRVALVLVAGRPIDPGWGDDGVRFTSAPASQVWREVEPGPAKQIVQMHFVNLPVTIANVGPTPVRVTLTGGATDDRGREAVAVLRGNSAWTGPHGRRPDWTSAQTPRIEPRRSVTRYITFPIRGDSRAAQFWLSPILLSSPEVSVMSPDTVVFRAQ
jgi:hypothetical protein